MKHTISHIIMEGDSLSDRGKVAKKKLLGFIPMDLLSGLKGKSPDGRFTNGLAWTDHLSAALANEFSIKKIEKNKHLDPTDIADGIIDHDPEIIPLIENSYDLNDDLYVKYRGKDFVRSYDEGGLTAYDYSWWPSKSIVRFISRMILPTLKAKRDKLLSYDKKHDLSEEHKAKTLIIEWSGANDLITVNERPSKEEVDRVIEERIKNVRELIKNGYRNFVLFNLPDLSLTPRYQSKNEKEQQNAKKWCKYFNDQLEIACQKLREENSNCSIDIFDADREFTAIYQHPEKYGMEGRKLKQPYTTSKDFKIKPDGTSPSTGYMFWDDVHPTADTHALLADKFLEIYRNKYHFTSPVVDKSASQLCHLFHEKYAQRLLNDKSRFFGFARHSNLRINWDEINPEAGLKEILKHALHKDGARTRKIITELGWIDKAGNLNPSIPVLKQARENLNLELFTSADKKRLNH